MNASKVVMHVMQTLYVAIVLGLILVSVSRDILEMDLLVQVGIEGFL